MTTKPKVIKRQNILVVMRDERQEETMRRHEFAMLKLLCAKHPTKAREYVEANDRKLVDMLTEKG